MCVKPAVLLLLLMKVTDIYDGIFYDIKKLWFNLFISFLNFSFRHQHSICRKLCSVKLLGVLKHRLIASGFYIIDDGIDLLFIALVVIRASLQQIV